MKKIIHFAIFLIIISLISPRVSLADRDCSSLLKGECVGCHEKEKYCDNIGKKKKYWKGMLKLMESNGADLTSAETATLIECLSTPSDLSKNICK